MMKLKEKNKLAHFKGELMTADKNKDDSSVFAVLPDLLHELILEGFRFTFSNTSALLASLPLPLLVYVTAGFKVQD